MRSQGSWCLRQHSNFESRRTFDNQIQPHSAPTSVALHQAENFRKFYRAVVSPTHVRVTAGGRIVPNTRAMAPPLFEPNGDNNATGGSQGSVIPVSTQGPPVFHPALPGPFLPPYGYLPQSVANMPVQHFGHPGNTQFPPQVINGNESLSSSLQPVRVSHPGQFDPNRPYMMVNNQMCFPTSAFPQPPNGFPPGLVSNSPFGPPMLGGPSGHHMTHPIHGTIPFMMPPGNFPGPLMHPSGQLFSMMPHQAQQTSMTSMLPLQLTSTEQTLQQHRDHLMMLEGYISRHSLQSVPYWATQRQILMGEISRMTGLLQSERNSSSSAQAEQGQSQTSVDVCGSLNALPSSSVACNPVVASSNTSTMVRIQEPPIPHVNAVPHTTRSADSPTVKQAATTKVGTGSRLPATAAMAPPFQPRSCRLDLSAAEWEEFAKVTDPRPGGRTSPPATPENTTQRLARLMGNCQTRWEDSAVGSSMISMPRSQTMPVPQFQPHAASLPSLRRSDTNPNSVTQMASMAYGPMVNSSNIGTQPYGRVHTQSHDTERFLAQKEYFGNSANSLSNHGSSTRQVPRYDTGRQNTMPTSPVRSNYNNQNTFTTNEYLTKCQSMFLPISNETGVTKYASPWPSPVRNSVSHNSLDSRARSNRPVPPFNLTTQSVINESVTGVHVNSSDNNVENPRGISADAQGLNLLANVFAETPQKYLNSEKQPEELQEHECDHNSSVEQVTEFGSLTRNDLGAIFASEDQDEPEQSANPPIIRQHKSTDLAVVFASEEPHALTPRQVTKSASGGELTHKDLGDIFASNETDILASSYKIEQPTIPINNRPHTSEDLGIIFASSEPRRSASKRITKPASAPSLTHEDLGDIFCIRKSTSITKLPSKTKFKCPTTYICGFGGILRQILQSRETKSIGSWTRHAEHQTSTSARSGNEKENLIFTPKTQDGSPKSKSSFIERLRITSSAVQKNQILKNLLNLQPATHSAAAAPAHVFLRPMLKVSFLFKIEALQLHLSLLLCFASPSTPEDRSRTRLSRSFHRSPEHLGNEDYLDCLKEIAHHTSLKRSQAEK
ncbi:hypothetical protein DID88_007952 [Monilinia fructigena]|uniref:Uncharacterized protein n=1 Tax=Monilinia fructigena TaxID=38457 RepID=A0A395J4X8_9HELO|nr:hypothetical protein DID88_007952 [Monilinia fructigena]